MIDSDFNKIDNEILKLDNKENLDIFSIEDILAENIEAYKKELHHHIEEVLQQKVDEKRIIIKKNKNGKIVDIVYATKEKKN